jgi:hypothetical protein
LQSGRHWGGQRDQSCHLSEVLDLGSEKELVLSTGRASQPEPVQAQDALDLLTSREYREMFCGTSFRHIGEVESITLDIAFYGTGSSSRKYLMLQHLSVLKTSSELMT